MAEIISIQDIKNILAHTDNEDLDTELLSKNYNIKINNKDPEVNNRVVLTDELTRYFINCCSYEDLQEAGTDLVIAGKILKVKLVNVLILAFIEEVIAKKAVGHKDQVFSLSDECLLDIDYSNGLSFMVSLTDAEKTDIDLTIKIKNLDNMNIKPKDKELNNPWDDNTDRLLISLVKNYDTPFNTTIKLSEFNKSWLIETLNILLLTAMDIF